MKHPASQNKHIDYKSITNPSVVVIKQDSEQPYYLHPPNNETETQTPQELIQSESSAHHGAQNTGELICESVDEKLNRHLERCRSLYSRNKPEPQKQGSAFTKEPKTLKERKVGSVMENIIERNKKTLGQKASQRGSYMVVHTGKKACAALEETLHPAGYEDDSVSMLRLQQKTQQMQMSSSAETKVFHQSKEKEEQPGSSLPALTDTSRFPSKMHHNVHINTPSHLLLPPKQTRQDSMINPESFNDQSSWNSVPDLVLCSGSRRFNQNASTKMSRNRKQPQKQGGRAEKRQMALETERKPKKWNPSDETCTPQHAMTPTTSVSESLSSFTVLPPIGDTKKGSCEEDDDDEEAQSTAQPRQRCCSDGYLMKMEKQKQIQAKLANKHHAEKMERQTLPLKGIDQQKKRISRIPVTAARGSDGKDKNVPRTKALEYAKTIVKPTRQINQRPTEQPKRRIEHALYPEGLDTSQLATLESFIKRHEEEKKAIALYRKNIEAKT